MYDAFNEASAQGINAVIEKILRAQQVKTVLDLTCGTGSQVFWLHRAGFEVVGSDINAKMLGIAKQKARTNNVDVKLVQADCRTAQLGHFDAVITIFNAIGHLTRVDFEQTLQTIHDNLNPGGIYVFDIFNAEYLKHDNNITKLTIDWITTTDQHKVREIQFSTISDDGVLASYSTYVHQDGGLQLSKIVKGYGNTLQCYSAEELSRTLAAHGFETISQTGIDGHPLDRLASERLLTVARRTISR